MIKKYIYGNPIETDAVLPNMVKKIILVEDEGVIPAKRIFEWKLAQEDMVFGLGETMRGINKRGGRYVFYNTDDPHHRQDMPSMYGTHDFFVVDGSRRFGIFVDTPARTTVEVDYQKSGLLSVVAETSSLNLYVIEGKSAYDITKQFLHIIGRSYLPPLYAFGFGQSRWGYKSQTDIDRVVQKYRENNLPLDYVCMDIDYMDRYIDFTINNSRYPNLKEFVEKKKEQGVHLVPIIDAGVKVEPGNETYDEGIENHYFCTNKEGKEFQAAVWPGMTHFPDFFQPEARAWFGSKYKVLTDLGIDGFWNDMNEPAIFYSEYTQKQNPIKGVLNFLIPSLAEKDAGQESNAYKDYHNFYHLINRERVNHHEVHNLFGAFMTRAGGEGLDQLLDHRYFLFSRSSYIGAHRYGGIWTGDNNSSFEMLRQNMYMMPGLNMCGFLYSGADTGGFGGNCNRELLLRWLQLSTFTPLMRDHTSLGTRAQECYAFGDTQAFRNVLNMRYRLLPYLYSEFMKAALNEDMLIKPMAFAYPKDEKARRIEDQLIVGESIMIAPITTKEALTRNVYLPEEMLEVHFDGEAFHMEERAPGLNMVTIGLDENVFFIRKDHAIVVANKQVQSTSEIDLSDVTKLGYDVKYDQYVDDGYSKL